MSFFGSSSTASKSTAQGSSTTSKSTAQGSSTASKSNTQGSSTASKSARFYNKTAKEIALIKLIAHPDHKNKQTGELEQLAIELTSPEKIRKKFDHLLQDGYRMTEDLLNEDDDDNDLLHTLELEAHHERVKHDTSKACHLPVRLLMRELRKKRTFSNFLAKTFGFEYGALHTALIVGDVVIEWGSEELVEPRIQPNFMLEFRANVGDQGEWHEREGQYQADMSLANRQRDRERKLDIVCEAIENKALLIDKLVEVIVEYNCNKTYSVFHCNCQDFAREALAALGIKKPIEFNGMLRQRFEALKEGNRKVPTQLQSHENLDLYVEGVKNDSELGLQDLEYLQCLYFAEHLREIEKCSDPNNWKCEVRTCKSAKLDELIEQKSLPHKRLLRDTTNSQTPLQLQYRSQAQGTDLATAGPNHYTLQAPSGQQQSTQPNETDIIRASTTPPATNMRATSQRILLESEGLAMAHQKSIPVISKSSQRRRLPHYTPGFEKCLNHDCKNPKTETGYCDVCNYYSQQPTACTVQGTNIGHKFQAQSSPPNNCFLCTMSDLSDRNEVCHQHKQRIIQMYSCIIALNLQNTETTQANRGNTSNYENSPMPHSDGAPQTRTTHHTSSWSTARAAPYMATTVRPQGSRHETIKK